MVDHRRGASGRVGRGVREEPRAPFAWIPARVSVRRDFMIAKDPHVDSTESLRQEQCLRDRGDPAGIIYTLNPECQDFVPRHLGLRFGPSRTEAGAEPWKFQLLAPYLPRAARRAAS